jgi:hypothetical protein
MSEKWEVVCDDTWRLEVDGGYLYRVGQQLAFVPRAVSTSLGAISEDICSIAESLRELQGLVEGATFELERSRGVVARAIRVSNVGD